MKTKRRLLTVAVISLGLVTALTALLRRNAVELLPPPSEPTQVTTAVKVSAAHPSAALYASLTPMERSQFLTSVRGLPIDARVALLKECYRRENDPHMRIEILSYFEEFDPGKPGWDLLALLVRTESDPNVREAILMTASSHGVNGRQVLDLALLDGEPAVKELAQELIEEM